MNTSQYLLSIVVPAYNEEDRLPITVDAILNYLEQQQQAFEIIIVDDGSQDRTVDIAYSYTHKRNNVIVIENEHNRGKGAVVKQGVLSAKGKYILFTDADNATHIKEIKKLWHFIDDFPVVIGSRNISNANIQVSQPFHRKVLSRLGNRLIRALIINQYRDTNCGFKLFQHDPAKRIFENVTITGFGFDVEVLLIAKRLGYPVFEQGINWQDQQNSRVRVVKSSLYVFYELLCVKYRDIMGYYTNPPANTSG